MRLLARWGAIVCVLAFVPAAASAHVLDHPSKMTTSQQLAYGHATVRHAQAVIRTTKANIAALRTVLHPRVGPWRMLSGAAQTILVRDRIRSERVRLRNHRYLLGLGRRLVAQAEAKLVPRLPWPFWNCVATGWTGGRPGVGSHVSGGEGGATSYNPAGYYGRYQMDWGFMRSHGSMMLRKYGGRPASSWSVLDQTIVAERGYQAQGPYAWPNTAPPCVYLR